MVTLAMAQKRSGKKKKPAPKARPARLPPGRWVVIALVAIYAVGFWARFENYPGWLENRAEFFYNEQPILASGDGYWYLRLARDLAEDNYEAVDLQRRFPDAPLRPSPPPLLSSLTSVLHRILGVSLERVAVFLPVLLAPFVLLPLYLIVRAAGGSRAMGLGTALLAVVSEYYVGRTRVGVYDTDCAIVTFTFAICYCVYRFAVGTKRARYAFAAAAAVGYGLFYWWWDTATTVVSAVCLPMFAVALVFFYRPQRREGLVFAASVAVVVVAVLAWRGLDAPLSLVRGVLGTLAFVGGEEVAGPFPSGVGNIRELQVLPFAQMSRLVAGHAAVWVVAAAGLLWWLWEARRRTLLLAVPVLLAVLPMFFGNRFLIFQVPVIAVGFGYVVGRLWDLRERWSVMTTLAPVAAIAVAALCYSQAAANLYRSPMARSMKAIDAVVRNTPEDATVWSTFWHGYPILYYANRAAITDGSTLEGPRLVYQNLPLAASNPRLAANFMQFWVGQGSAGMERLYEAAGGDHGQGLRLLREVCARGPESARPVIAQAVQSGQLAASADFDGADDWLRFFFPARRSRLFLLLTQDLTESMVWFERGTWDPTTRSGTEAHYSPFYGVRRQGDTIQGSRGLRIDTARGVLQAMEPDGKPTTQRLSRIVTLTAQGPDTQDLGGGGGMSFEWVPPRRFGAAMSRPVAESLFNRLFVRHQGDERYFRPVVLETPSHQLWEVRGDALR